MKAKSQKTSDDRVVVNYATLCCCQKVDNEELEHAAVKCSACGRPAVVIDFRSTPEFANAIYDAHRVNSPKSVAKALGPGWRQVTPWHALGRHVGSLERAWYEYGADPSSVVLVRYLTSFALFVRQDPHDAS